MQSNLAYKLDNAAAESLYIAPDLARFRAQPAEEETAQTVEPQTRERAAARVHMRLSPVALFVYLCSAALLLMVVYGYMTMSTLNADINGMTNELNRLKAEESKMAVPYGKAVDTAEMEAYALNVLGMVRPGSENIVYIDLAGEDHGVVYPVESKWDSVKNSFGGFFDKVAYFFG